MTLSGIRVGAGYLLAALVVGFARPTAQSIWIGAPFAVAGEALRIWASGHIEKTRSLATGGPYAHTRNPLYLGSALLALAAAVATASLVAATAIFLYLTVFYPAVVREEAAFLRAQFPGYAEWEQAVPLFLPRLRPAGPRASRFSWARVEMNREWRTALALPLVFGLLWLRGLYRP
jgi:protein-S-isoprenylcysteine O-methyltransferase Ste14